MKTIIKTFLLGILTLLVFISSCEKSIDPETARQMVTYRNLGLAQLENGDLQSAIENFQNLTHIAPDEPLGFANLGLCYLHLNNMEEAEKWLDKAMELQADNPEVSLLIARVYDFTNRENQAIYVLEEALKKHPSHTKLLFKLALYYENSTDAGLIKKTESNLSQILHSLPANMVARLKLVELFLKSGRTAQALENMEIFRQMSPLWPEGSNIIFSESLDFMREGNAPQALNAAIVFHNYLKSTAIYQAGLTQLIGNSGPLTGEPVLRFLHPLADNNMKDKGLPATLNFTEIPLTTVNLQMAMDSSLGDQEYDLPVSVMALGDCDGDKDEDIFISHWIEKEHKSRQYLFLNENNQFKLSAANNGISHPGRDIAAAFADYDNDGYLDLFVANSLAGRLYHNDSKGTFSDVSKVSGLSAASKGQKILFADFDLEGDLDLFMGSASQNLLFRNNMDGTFTDISEKMALKKYGEISDTRDACFADFDDDGDIDFVFINYNNNIQYFENLRQSNFKENTLHPGIDRVKGSQAVIAGDYNNDGAMDLFVTGDSGKHILLKNSGNGTFEPDNQSETALKSIENLSGKDAVFFDADNDGYLDFLVAGIHNDALKKKGLGFFVNNGKGVFLDGSSVLPDINSEISQILTSDFDNDGDMDIIYAEYSGKIHLLRNDGGNLNNYHTIRLTGLRTGSGKNNYFGIGSKVEVKAGTSYQMKVMDSPVVHFGIGKASAADLIRVVWTNGVLQNTLNPQTDQTILETQVLKGSCPWLFAWNGERYEFVTDVLWPSALGMPLGIMGGEITYAFANSTDEYLKIPGEKLKMAEGKYALQFTTELWETPYLDKIRLLAVDHPENSDIFINEQFTPPPFAPFRIYHVFEKKLPVSASDENGKNVLQKISAHDGDYITSMDPADFQGVMKDHDLILDLGDVSGQDSLFLFLNGWLFPTDASINVNISQSDKFSSIPPSIQVIDQDGNWKTAVENIFFPKGKNKTMVIDLSDRFIVKDYRIRIHSNMQIYWDYIFYSQKANNKPVVTQVLAPTKADLHYRGFSQVHRETYYSPHIPDYQKVSVEPKWYDLAGSYTRFGDVLPLLLDSDNKYVIMNAGDEVTLEFDASGIAELAPGWKRDFLFYNDGWLKDGDLNTAFGKTVEPLPFHGMNSYPYGKNQKYPDSEEYRTYQKQYNSRVVTTSNIRRQLQKVATD